MKKLSCVLLVLMVLLVGTNAIAKESIVWTMQGGTPERQAALDKNFVQPFNESQDSVVLSIKIDPNMESNVRKAMLAGSGPDLVMTPGITYAQQYVADGYLLALDDYAKEYGWYDRFLPVMIDLLTFDGHLYALPKTYESMVMFYNKTLFEQHGWTVPTNREELETLAQEMMEKGIIPFGAGNASWRGNNEHYVGVFLNHYAGPEKVHQALVGEIPWTSPELVESIELLNEYYQKGYFGRDYFSLEDEDFVSLLATGQAGMAVIGTWGFQWMEDYFGMTGQDWDWTSLPAFSDEATYPLYDLGIGATLSINAASKNPDGVAAALDMLSADKEVVVSMNRDWPGEWNVPVSTLEAEDFAGEFDVRYARHVEEVANSVKNGGYGYTVWTFWPQKTAQYMIEGIELVWLGEITPEEYMTEVDRLFQDELKQGVVPPIPSR